MVATSSPDARANRETQSGSQIGGGRRLLAGIAALVVSAALLSKAWLGTDEVVIGALFALAGCLAGMIGAGLIAVSSRRWTSFSPLMLLLGAAAAGSMTAFGFLGEIPIAAAVGSAVLVLISGVAYESGLRNRLEGLAPHDQQAVQGSTIVQVVAAVFLGATLGLFGLSLVTVIVWSSTVALLAGFKFIVGGYAKAHRESPSNGRLVWLVAGLALMGVAALGVHQLELPAPFTTAGAAALAWLTVVGLSAAGVICYEANRIDSASKIAAIGLFGAAAVAAAFALLGVVLPDSLAALLVVALAAVLGAYLVWPGEGALLLVALAFVVTWVSANREAPTAPEFDDDPTAANLVDADAVEWIVVFGDSFISGEGSPRFLEGTASPGVNVCHRSPGAWPQLLGSALEATSADGTQVRVKSFACSGALIDHIADEPQHGGALGEYSGRERQLDDFERWASDLDENDLITHVAVSAGGNDAGFSSVIAACLLPGSNCAEIVDTAFTARADVRVDLAAALHDVVERVGEQSRVSGLGDDRPLTVLVNPYLDPFGGQPDGVRCSSWGPTGTDSLIDEREIAAVSEFRRVLNSQVSEAVDRASADMNNDRWTTPPVMLLNAAGANVDGRICLDEPRQNWLVLRPDDGAPGDTRSALRTLLPNTWVSGSVHPNEAGHRAIAETVLATLDSPVSERIDSVEATNDSLERLADACGVDEAETVDATACSDTWLKQASAMALTTMAPLVLLSVLGGFCLGLALHGIVVVRSGPFDRSR